MLNNEIVFVGVFPSPSKTTFLTDKDKANLLRNPISISINVHCAKRNRVTGLGGNLGPSESPETSQPLRLISHCQLGKWAATTPWELWVLLLESSTINQLHKGHGPYVEDDWNTDSGNQSCCKHIHQPGIWFLAEKWLNESLLHASVKSPL